MRYLLARYQNAARGVLSSFALAVLFLLGLTLSQLFICCSSQAIGLDIRLEEKNRSLVRFGHLPRQLGLSISSDSIPFLKTKLIYSQSVLVEYEHGFVSISEKQGEYKLSKPLFLTLSTYNSTSMQLQLSQEWRENLNTHFLRGSDASRGLFEWEIPVKFPKVVSKIIGEGGPGLKVSGYRKISFSGRSTWEEGLKNTATSRQSKFPSLHMEQYSSFDISGTIGSKISVEVDEDSRNTDLENRLQLRYRGEEDEIIQTVEAGNTNLSVGSGVVGYSEKKQGLFGIKTTAKLGGWNLTMITSQDKGSSQKAEFTAGAETRSDVIRDYQYLERTFYDLGDADDFYSGDSIVEIKLFKSNISINSNTAENPAPFGVAYINPDPQDTATAYPEGSFERRFQEIDPEEYFVQRNQYWIQFFAALEKNDILGAFYVVRRNDATFDTVGFLKDSCTSAEDETCMTLKLIKPETPKPDDYTWDYEWKNVYYLNARNIEREGFSLSIYKGVLRAENIDEDPNYQDSTLLLRIFGLDQLDLDAQEDPDGIVDYRQIDFGLGYLIFPNRHPFAPSPNRSFTDNPGDTLKEKVESIYTSNLLDDRIEQSKYYIHVQTSSRKTQFQLGHAPIIEGSEVVTLNGRTLTRGEDYTIMYEFGEISFINPEASSPTANLSVEYDYAPLFMLEKKSMFGMMAEYSLGNKLKFGTVGIYKSEKTADERPRVGQEPIRNFIWGSNLSFSSSPTFITKMLNSIPWVKTDATSTFNFKGDIAQSIPNPNTKNHAFIDDFEGSLEYTDLGIRRGVWTLSSPPKDKDLTARCKMLWYNPYDQVPVKEIWPYKEVERNEEKTNVLELKFSPQEPHHPSNPDFDTSWVENNWNGVIRSIYTGAYDQTRTKFLEIWVRGDKGILHVDLGEISEDLDEDRALDTEDKARNGQKDGILDEDEDVGIDGLNNQEEQELYGYTLSDPSGDDWNYDNRYDYSQINGTENNRNDPDRGRRLDTEDINSNSVLDLTNNYFEFSIDLSKSEFLGDLSDSAGWRLYRIPLKDPLNYVLVGNPSWSDIRFARIWISSPEECIIGIASIQLVGNRWENLGITSLTNRQIPLPIGTSPDEEFEVFVKNTHENPSYDPPPGIAGTLNRQTGVREKEQSLVLSYKNLLPNHQGSAYRILYDPEDYTAYKYLKMFVHGPDDPGELMFFLSLGQDSLNVYEYHTQIYPGWDERNEVVIDFDKITALKAYAMDDSTAVSDDGSLYAEEGSYRVKGKPTLNKIRWFSLGVVNIDSTSFKPVSGEVWVDELRVMDIRKEKDVSGNITLSAKLADLANLSFTFTQKGAEYRSLTQTRGSGKTSTNYNLNLSGVQVHKFLPVSIGYRLPVSINYTKKLDLPKWKSGSDIVLPKDLREKEKYESVSKGISFSPAFDHPTKNWLVGATLKRINHSFSYNTSRSTSLQTPVLRNSSTTINGGYTFPLGKGLSVKPFGWLKSALVPKSFTQMSFSLLPTSVSTSGSISETRSHSESNVGVVYDTHTKTFNGNLNIQANPIKGIPLSYNMTTSRDIKDPKTIKYSLDPKKAKLGVETSYTESFKTKYTPSWLAFLNASFNFESRYKENSYKLDSYNVGGTRTVNNDNSLSTNFALNWQKLLGAGDQKEGKKSSLLNPLNLLRKLTQRIDPVSISYRKNKNFSKSGLLGRPTLTYRLGFTDNPGVGRKGQAQSTDRLTISENYSAKSGIKLLSTYIGLTYSRSISRTITATEATKNVSTLFPDLGFNLNKLGEFKLFKKYFTTLTYNFKYSRRTDERGSERTNESFSKKTTDNFSPLSSFSMTWKNGIRTTIKITRQITTDQNLKVYGGNQSITKNYNNAINIGNNYSFSAPHGIKLPFLKKIRFKSNLSLSLTVSKIFTKTKSSVGGQPFNVTADNSRLSIASTAGYSFSTQVTGGFTANWSDTNDKKTQRKTHTRELGIWIQIKF